MYGNSFMFFSSRFNCASVIFLNKFIFCVQADPVLGLLGFGGGMDFNSDKAYR